MTLLLHTGGVVLIALFYLMTRPRWGADFSRKGDVCEMKINIHF